MSNIRSKKTDTTYLLNSQYKDASNLSARALLHHQFSTNKYGWQRWLFDHIECPPNARLIDFGAGPGWLWAENQNRIAAGWEITLSDFSSGMIAESQHNLAGSSHPFKFEIIDVQSIPYADATFDVVFANHMLYHVPDLNKALTELRRILKPTGKLYTATNGERHLRELHELQARFDSNINYWEGFSAARSFELDNGAQLLSSFFPAVKIDRYEDALIVTEAEPLVGYILSGKSKTEIVGDKLTALRHFIQQEIEAHGAIYITKDSGILISALA
jgi:SAM-dependent methyltransferase